MFPGKLLGSNQYWVFEVLVRPAGRPERSIWRRYSEFAALRKKLEKRGLAHVALCPLPSAVKAMMFDYQCQDDLFERMEVLDRFIQRLSLCPAVVKTPEFAQFCDCSIETPRVSIRLVSRRARELEPGRSAPANTSEARAEEEEAVDVGLLEAAAAGEVPETDIELPEAGWESCYEKADEEPPTAVEEPPEPMADLLFSRAEPVEPIVEPIAVEPSAPRYPEF